MKLQDASRIGERYWMATLLLTIIIIACIAVTVHQQMEVNKCRRSHNECRNRIEELVELKGWIQERNNHSLMLKEKTDLFLSRTFSSEDQAIKRVEDYEKRLREMENSNHKLVVIVTTIIDEKNKLAVKYDLCNKKLAAACELKKKS